MKRRRQVEFSQQTQTIILRGLVRPEDISQQNQVLSTAISSLELEVRGKGIINDYTHRQNAARPAAATDIDLLVEATMIASK